MKNLLVAQSGGPTAVINASLAGVISQALKEPSIDTVFLLTRPDYSYVSSSGVRELFRFHGDIHGLVPECVAQAMMNLDDKERK